jgi:putative ABC transport system permease protein
MATMLNYKDPVGRRIFEISGGPDQHIPFPIIGVVKDFHYESLHKEIRPMIIKLLRSRQVGRYTTVRIQPEDVQKTIAFIEQEWKKYAAGQAFEYEFFDEQFTHLYFAEEQTQKIVAVFSGLAVLIACLGLFGLASFTTEQRTREIGIRKTFGASIINIFSLLCSDILKLLVISTIVAFSVSYYLMTKWLQNYAYQIGYDFIGYILAGVLALVVAILTISHIALRAAGANPIKALKYE